MNRTGDFLDALSHFPQATLHPYREAAGRMDGLAATFAADVTIGIRHSDSVIRETRVFDDDNEDSLDEALVSECRVERKLTHTWCSRLHGIALMKPAVAKIFRRFTRRGKCL